jgi:alpha-tubulin suppressor-like RCC1 family protein
VCASLQGSTVLCWGSNGSGQLGRGDTIAVGGTQAPAAATPPAAAIMPSGRSVIAMASGSGHTCALMDNNYLECWGSNGTGQLGLGLPPSGSSIAIGDDEAPATFGGLQLANVTSICTRGTSTCAGLVTGGLRCWGQNSKAQLGYGDITPRGGDNTTKPSNLPDVSFGSGVAATLIAMGSTHVCALLNNSQVKCWGRDNLGQLGNATVMSGSTDYVTQTPDQLPAVQVFPP